MDQGAAGCEPSKERESEDHPWEDAHVIGEFVAEFVIAMICEAAGIPVRSRPKLDAAGTWMRENYAVDRLPVLEAIGKQAARMRAQGEAIRSLAVFNELVLQLAKPEVE